MLSVGFIYGCPHGIWKFPGQGSNLSRSCNLYHCSQILNLLYHSGNSQAFLNTKCPLHLGRYVAQIYDYLPFSKKKKRKIFLFHINVQQKFCLILPFILKIFLNVLFSSLHHNAIYLWTINSFTMGFIFCLFDFFWFFWPYPQHVEVQGPGIEPSLQLQPVPQR